MARRLRSPILWVGGKARLADWIVPQLRIPANTYVEPFGGSASILLNRDPAAVEVYNDLDGALATFMLCVRDHPEELLRHITDLPYARLHHDQEQEWMKAGCPGRMTDIQFAARWWWLNVSGYGGQLTGGFGTARLEGMQVKVRSRAAVIDTASKRLSDVLIEHDDFRVIIARYDSPVTLFYCDPPYVGAESVYIEDAFSEADHIELARLLNSIEGKAAVSYYPCPLIDELYPADRWRRNVKKWKKSLGAAHAEQLTESEELLLMNYDPPKQGRLDL